MFIRFLCTVLLILILPNLTRAESPDGQPLEMKRRDAVALLAIDPFPADALLYAGKKEQAILNGILGAIGMGLFVSGIVNYDEVRNGDDYSDEENIIMAISGLGIYVVALVWDGVGGFLGVTEHNRRVEAQQAARSFEVQPMIRMTENGMAGGFRVAF